MKSSSGLPLRSVAKSKVLMPLCGAYEGRAYNLCYRMLGDTESAADATQDTFLAAFRHLRSFRGGSFRSWLLRIATNTCYDALRARKRRPTVSLDIDSDDESAHSPLQIADTAELPDEFAQRRELAAEIPARLGGAAGRPAGGGDSVRYRRVGPMMKLPRLPARILAP